MIKANELRIGNVCKDELTDELLIVCSLSNRNDKNDIGFAVINREKFPLPNGWQATYIPLTPEILEKCGFVQHHDDCSNGVIYIKSIFEKLPFTWGLYPESLGSGIIVKDSIVLIYLHQLQNLYFALTGEELTVNL